MNFDRKRAELSIVEVIPGRAMHGMGFHLLDNLIATACHCLPRVERKVILPSPDALGLDPVAVQLRQWGSRAAARALVMAADPCSDLALLGSSTLGGTDLPSDDSAKFDDLMERLLPASPELEPPDDGRAFIYTHEGKWVEGTARRSFLFLRGHGKGIRGGTSGAPVFSASGKVLGIVSFADGSGQEVRFCSLARHLPGWVLSLARQEKEGAPERQGRREAGGVRTTKARRRSRSASQEHQGSFMEATRRPSR